MSIAPQNSTELPVYPIPRASECPYRPSAEHVALRENGPMTKVKLYNGRTAWLVTSGAEAREILSDYRRVSIRPYHGNFPLLNEEFEKVVDSGYADVLFGADPPEHTRQRQMIMPSFTLRRAATLRPEIQRIVDDSLDEMTSKGQPAELVSQFAQPVPSMVMSLILGVPWEEHEDFEAPAHKLFIPELADEATEELGEYLDGLIGRKENGTGLQRKGLLDDLIFNHLHRGALSRSELVHIAMAMLVAGTDTTTNVISLGTLLLLDHPEQWAALREDLSLIPAATEEILRYVSLVEAFARVAVEDMTIGGQLIKAGDGILISCAGVNFDPETVPNPEVFDILRPTRPSFSFSHGIHRCPGDNLARVELEIAFRALVERFPNLKTTVPTNQLRHNNNDGTLERLYELPVVW